MNRRGFLGWLAAGAAALVGAKTAKAEQGSIVAGNNPHWTRLRPRIEVVTESRTLTEADNGKLLLCKGDGWITLTAPSASGNCAVSIQNSGQNYVVIESGESRERTYLCPEYGINWPVRP